MTYIPGYDAVLELGATPDDVSAVGTAVSLRKTFAERTRNTFGNAHDVTGVGPYGVRFTFRALVDSATAGTIEGHADGSSVAFSLEVGDAAGTSAGTWAGNCRILEISMEARPDGDWEMEISAKSTGAVTFT